ncbi:MAG: hypothetical protein RL695_1676 [Pseudomonadota bacterium]|jgi:two-component system phosphate regulon sensor histidine kinase PhoR
MSVSKPCGERVTVFAQDERERSLSTLMALLGRTLLLTLLAAAPALLVGWWSQPGYGWAVFCVGLLLQQLDHFRYFARLDRWSRNPSVDPDMEAEGGWDELFGRLYRHEKDLRQQIAQRDQNITLLRDAAQALTDGIVMLDDGNRIMFCNVTAENQLGLRLGSDRGQSILNLVRQPEFSAYLEMADFTQPLVLRAERPRDQLYALHVIPYAEHHRLLQVKDVTQAHRIERMRRDFVANVSHELRTPLTILSGFLETLQELDIPADDRQRYLALMSEQSQRMQSIVQDLLTLSTLESSPPPENEVVDMNRLIDQLFHDAQALSGGRHTLRLNRESATGNLRGSAHELASALGNLMSNAVRYTPAGGSITLIWRISAQGATFAVQDTGPGIEAQHLPRLTERFYRVDRGRSREAGGTGLGLAIVKHVLGRHQAQLDIQSELGKGSRFTARFPASRVDG